LQRTPGSRLGVNGIKELKSHYWFQETNWEKLVDKSLSAPYKPAINKGKIQENKSEEDATTLKLYEEIMKNENKLFKDYYFDSEVNKR